MEKLVYELKPMAFFLFSIWALAHVQIYKPIAVPAALLLILSASLIMMMRMNRRNAKSHKRK